MTLDIVMLPQLKHQSHNNPWEKLLISWTWLKLKSSVLLKTISREWKDKPQTGIWYLKKDIKNCFPKYTKTSLNHKIMNNLIRKWAKNLDRQLTKEDILMANKHMMRCSLSFVTREMQLKTVMRYHYTPLWMAKL